MHTIHVFISHSWKYTGHYNTLYQWICETPWDLENKRLAFKDFSVTKDNPIHDADNDKQLYEAIDNQIKRTHAVIIPTGIYASHSKWIKKEIEIAKLRNKPIIAINPWGNTNSSCVVYDNANHVVGWNSQPLINKILECFRNGC